MTSTSPSGDRSWEDALRYGFISAGGGEIWTKPLERLFPGARVFLYKPYPVKGYVGVGVVKEKVRPVTEFEVEVDASRVPILDAPLADRDKVVHDADDPQRREHLVRIEWLKTRPTEDAAWQSGLFTNQVPVCKLRDRDTIEFLEDAFAVKEERRQRLRPRLRPSRIPPSLSGSGRSAPPALEQPASSREH